MRVPSTGASTQRPPSPAKLSAASTPTVPDCTQIPDNAGSASAITCRTASASNNVEQHGEHHVRIPHRGRRIRTRFGERPRP
ncbi:hypothetical protein [Amycolatopsis sp. YIM 10]|uniref:hypothetical protein n=1 Tax=Amycolatopsis sp. YIM 10 TaxID=2653857 RepID=UPI001884318E|nr:hypothetical protein [Amycolatopsis sp. YIM 10]